MKKPISCILAGTLIVSALSGCGGETARKELTPVRLNEVVHSVFYAPQYAAMELGFFEEEGLRLTVDVGNGADKSMTALLSDAADIALLGTEAGIYVCAEGKEEHPKAFLQLTQRAGNFLVSRKEEPDFKWTDLKGKAIIGGRPGGMPEMILEYILKQNHIIPKKDADIVNNIDFSSTAGAFSGGIGDYTVEFEPAASMLEQSGAGHIAASLGEAGGLIPYTVYMAQDAFLKEHPDTVAAFSRAILKGQKWVREHSAEEIAEVILPQFPESDLNTLAVIAERYKAQDTWASDPVLSREGFALLQKIMEEGGQLKQPVPYEALVNTEIAEALR